MVDLNFHPIVKCPNCEKPSHPVISGWGGELSTRVKACSRCGQEYRLLVYAFTDTEIGNTTSSINGKIDRIKYLKQRIREKLMEVTNIEAEWAEEYMRVNASSKGKQN